MSNETRKDIRFYTPLVMGFALMIIGVFCPPIGAVASSILYGVAMFLTLSAGVLGIDVPEILKQVNELKRIKIEERKTDEDEK